jgi:hypothetical protein
VHRQAIKEIGGQIPMETNTAIRHDAEAVGPIAMAFSGANGLVSPLGGGSTLFSRRLIQRRRKWDRSQHCLQGCTGFMCTLRESNRWDISKIIDMYPARKDV